MVSDNAAMALDDYIAKSKIGKGGRGGNRGGGRSRGKKAVLVCYLKVPETSGPFGDPLFHLLYISMTSACNLFLTSDWTWDCEYQKMMHSNVKHSCHDYLYPGIFIRVGVMNHSFPD